MPRININDQIWVDPRTKALFRKYGEAQGIGMLVMAWRVAQDHHPNPVPKDVYLLEPELFDPLIKFKLAKKTDDNGIYCSGANDNFAWLAKARKGSKKGGEANAKRLASEKERASLETLKGYPTDTKGLASKGQRASLEVLKGEPSNSNSNSNYKYKTKFESEIGKIDAVRDAWNEIMGDVTRWQRHTTKRRSCYKARVKQFPDFNWKEYFSAIRASPFHTGQNDRGWKANPDFALREDNITKFLEGGFKQAVQEKQTYGLGEIKRI